MGNVSVVHELTCPDLLQPSPQRHHADVEAAVAGGSDTLKNLVSMQPLSSERQKMKTENKCLLGFDRVGFLSCGSLSSTCVALCIKQSALYF